MTVSSASVSIPAGYHEVASDGGIFSFGDAQFDGSTGGTNLNKPIVGMAATKDGLGYWLVASDGGIFSFGDAQFDGSTGGTSLNQPIVGMAATSDGMGYWLVASDGGIFAFGDAQYFGSTGATRLNKPIVGMAATSDGMGYWLVASDGGIFSFGDAQFEGSTGATNLNKPIVGMAATSDGMGYWLVASDGGIFAFGDAQYFGSTGATNLNQPIVGMAATSDGMGYWLVASDGGIFSFGDAQYSGSTGATSLNKPIVGMAVTPASGTPHALPPPSSSTRQTEVVYGSAGSFGDLAGASALPGGQSLATQAVPGWGFLPGQSVMGAVLGPDGSIVMGGEPQTSNQALATASTMSLSVFNPSAQTFQNVVIPTSAGATSVTQPGFPTGGADISAIASVPGQGHQVAFMSAWPYRGWDANALGEYPTFGYVAPSASGSYQYVPGSGRSAYAIASSDSPTAACPVQPSSFIPPIADCRGPSAMAVLPASGDIVVAQYYNNIAAGTDSGGLMVLSPDGRLVGSIPYPNVSSNGSPVYAYPREVDADPTSTLGNERFTVIFDVFVGGPGGTLVQSAFTMQEFSFDSSTGSISPQSAPFLPGQSVGGRTGYFEAAHFDQNGNLWAAESVVGAISGGNIVEYTADSMRGRLVSGSCAAGPSWPTDQWDEVCPPDRTFTASAGQGDVRSITEDTATGALYFATISGVLVPVVPTGVPSSPWVVGPLFDYGINSLVNRNTVQILPRQGVLDPATGYLWLPIEQVEGVAACAPSGNSCQSPPAVLHQWLLRIDVRQ